MLAEGRRKQKISTNPNGLSFINDESNIGQKLLSKMGWERGKGLGLNSQGDADPIRVRANIESRGLGCKRSDVDKWIAHQDDFNSVLANLNQSANNPGTSTESTEEAAPSTSSSTVLSLEAKSKSSRSRVHYMKFTKGKDLSSHSEKDLACILGPNRSGTNTPHASSKPSSQACSKANSDNEEEKGSDPFLSDTRVIMSSMSLHEYFASKLAAKRNSSANLIEMADKTPSPPVPAPEDSVNPIQPAFFIGDPESSDDKEEKDESTKKRKKKKKNKLKEEEQMDVPEPVEEEESESERLRRKKERKRKRREKREQEAEARQHHEEEEEEREASRHCSGGKTKPKPPDDTMKFVTESSDSSEQEVKQKKKSKKRRKRAASEEKEVDQENQPDFKKSRKSKSFPELQSLAKEDDVKIKKAKKKSKKSLRGDDDD